MHTFLINLGVRGSAYFPQPNVAQIQSGANQVKPLLVALKKAQATEEIGKNSKDVVNFSRWAVELAGYVFCSEKRAYSENA